MFDHVVRNFEIDAELIRRTRTAAKLTQEKLSEDICAQETLARIENGNQKPRSGNLRQMMEKMGRSGNRIETGIQVEEYETLELKIEFSKFMHRWEYENAKRMLVEIENKLDYNILQNRQYVETGKVKLEYQMKKTSDEELLQKLREILFMTLKCTQENSYVLTSEEMDILFEMALIYWNRKEYKTSLEIYRFQTMQYKRSRVKPQFHMIHWEMAVGNYGMALEELGNVEEAISISKNKVEQELYAGKGSCMEISLILLGCIMEKKNVELCKKYFRQSLAVLKLYKMDATYKVIKEYVEDKNIIESGKHTI